MSASATSIGRSGGVLDAAKPAGGFASGALLLQTGISALYVEYGNQWVEIRERSN
jgi:hypothetical protein